jgi:hypothetical protein
MQNFRVEPVNNSQAVGVEAHLSDAGEIILFTDASDEAVSTVTPADARALAAWLNAAADQAEINSAT